MWLCLPCMDQPAPVLGIDCVCQASSHRGALDVHEWHGVFRGEPAAFKMTSVIGHVYSLDFPPAYNSWDRVDPLELFDAQTVKSESNPKVSRSNLHRTSDCQSLALQLA